MEYLIRVSKDIFTNVTKTIDGEFIVETGPIEKYIESIECLIGKDMKIVRLPIYGHNLRRYLDKKIWQNISRYVRKKNNWKCSNCNRDMTDNTRDLHAHEQWLLDFNDCTMDIMDIVPLCNYCHQIYNVERYIWERKNGEISDEQHKIISEHWKKFPQKGYEYVSNTDDSVKLFTNIIMPDFLTGKYWRVKDFKNIIRKIQNEFGLYKDKNYYYFLGMDTTEENIEKIACEIKNIIGNNIKNASVPVEHIKFEASVPLNYVTSNLGIIEKDNINIILQLSKITNYYGIRFGEFTEDINNKKYIVFKELKKSLEKGFILVNSIPIKEVRSKEEFDIIKKEYVIYEKFVPPVEEFVPQMSLATVDKENQVTYKESSQSVKQMLIEKCRGKNLEDVINGKAINTGKGMCYHIGSIEKINHVNIDKMKENIISDLKLIKGIGNEKEKFLKSSGYTTIYNLKEHPSFKDDVVRFLNIFDSNDGQLYDWICDIYHNAHPLAIYLSRLHKKSKLLILDIETMGFASVPIILIGLARFSDNNISIDQYLSRNIGEEPAILTAFIHHLRKSDTLITFNGGSFDMPFIEKRLSHHGIKENSSGKIHYDTLRFSRRVWNDKLSNCKLETLEKHILCTDRKDDISSESIPNFYRAYIKDKNAGHLIPIIDHNKHDLIALANIFSKLHEF